MEQEQLIDDGLVERLHAALADALRRARPEPFTTPVTVAEIYQDLVPYRTVRTVLGFQMNADYEHTLLRLLAGEAGLARLDPSEAKDELMAELGTPNPNVGLFRKFAACDVWVEPSETTIDNEDLIADSAPGAVAEPPVPSAPLPPMTEPAPMTELTHEPTAAAQPEPPVAEPEPLEPVQRPPEIDEPEPQLEIETAAQATIDGVSEWREEQVVWAEPEAEAEGEWDTDEAELLLVEEVQTQDAEPDTPMEPVAAGHDETRHQREAAVMFDSNESQAAVATMGNCAFCQGSLPGGRVVKFCPFCGADQSTRPCSSCREPLEQGWKFCIGCGNQQS